MAPPVSPSRRSSWLSLVAETAGVSGIEVTRVQISCSECPRGTSSVVVQMQDRYGRVIGAARAKRWGADLAQGVSVDVGYDSWEARGATLIAWIEPSTSFEPARQLAAPARAARAPFDPLGLNFLALKGKPRKTAPAASRAAASGHARLHPRSVEEEAA